MLLLASFLVYFINISYQIEKERLSKEVGYIFVNAVKNVEGNMYNKFFLNKQFLGNGNNELKINILKQERDTIIQDKSIDTIRKKSIQNTIQISTVSSKKSEINNVNGMVSMMINLENDTNCLKNFMTLHDSTNNYFPVIEKEFIANLQKAGVNVNYSIGKDSISNSNKLISATYSDIGTNDKFFIQLNNNNGLIFKNILPQIAISILLFFAVLLAFFLILKFNKKQNELIQMKNDFIQNMTHELKTPVATMSIALEAIQNFKASENETMKSEYIQIARNEINKLDNLVDKVLSFIQISEHPILEEISINDFLNEVENSFNLRANQHNIDLKIQAIEKDIHYYGDKHNLKTVIFNLVDNALKYNQNQSGIVEISAQENHSFLTITVFDNGKPIPKDLAKSIFEKFYRVSEGNLHNVKGHGLGLYIVKMIVEKMNGSISLVSNDLGNYFIVKLPIK